MTESLAHCIVLLFIVAISRGNIRVIIVELTSTCVIASESTTGLPFAILWLISLLVLLFIVGFLLKLSCWWIIISCKTILLLRKILRIVLRLAVIGWIVLLLCRRAVLVRFGIGGTRICATVWVFSLDVIWRLLIVIGESVRWSSMLDFIVAWIGWLIDKHSILLRESICHLFYAWSHYIKQEFDQVFRLILEEHLEVLKHYFARRIALYSDRQHIVLKLRNRCWATKFLIFLSEHDLALVFQLGVLLKVLVDVHYLSWLYQKLKTRIEEGSNGRNITHLKNHSVNKIW